MLETNWYNYGIGGFKDGGLNIKLVLKEATTPEELKEFYKKNKYSKNKSSLQNFAEQFFEKYNPLVKGYEEVIKNCDEEVLAVYRKSLEIIKSLGGEIKTVKFDYPEAWIPSYTILATAEASSNLSRFDGVKYGFRAEFEDGEDMVANTRSQGFGDEVKRRIMLGTYVLSTGHYDAYYKKAQQVRRLIFNNYKDIFKEINRDLGKPTPTTGNLIGWAQQGVLLLNATLTVQAHCAGSHQGKGWETFTDAVINKLAAEKEKLVFMLWGSYAQKKGAFIDPNRHLVLKSVHPSPLSAYRGFIGNSHFSLANKYLRNNNIQEVAW